MSSIGYSEKSFWVKAREKTNFDFSISNVSKIYITTYSFFFLCYMLGDFLQFQFGGKLFSNLIPTARFIWGIINIIFIIGGVALLVTYVMKRLWTYLIPFVVNTVAISIISTLSNGSLRLWAVKNEQTLQLIASMSFSTLPALFLAVVFVALKTHSHQYRQLIEEKNHALEQLRILFDVKDFKLWVLAFGVIIAIVFLINTLAYIVTPWLLASPLFFNTVIILPPLIAIGIIINQLFNHLWNRPQVVAIETSHEEKIRLHQERENKLKLLGFMATNITHNLNQPIGIIRAIANIGLDNLEDGYFKTEDIKPAFENTLKQVDRLADIIRKFRELAQGDRPEREVLDLNDLVQKVAAKFSEQFGYPNTILKTELQIVNKPLAWANSFHLENILNNLLTNAYQAIQGQEHGLIWLKTYNDNPKYSQIMVEDNGPGVPLDFQETMFIPFVSTKSSSQGSGLGLYLTHQFITELGGTINYTNRPEGGACFTITLPTSQETVSNGRIV